MEQKIKTEVAAKGQSTNIDADMEKSALISFFFGATYKIFLWATLFLAIAIYIKLKIEPNYIIDIAHEVVRDIGIAFLVAGIISFCVEHRASNERNKIIEGFANNAEQMLQNIQKDSLNSFFEKELPEGWFEYLRDQIASHDLIRSNMRLSFRFHKIPDDKKDLDPNDEHVLMQIETNYDVENISENEKRHRVPCFIEIPECENLKKLVSLDEFRVDGKDLSEEQLAKARSNIDDTEKYDKYLHPTKIPKGRTVRVNHVFRTPQPKKGKFVWISQIASNGIEVSAYESSNIRASISVLHNDCLSTAISKETEPGKRAIIETDKPVPPCTAVEVSWQPK